MNKYQFQEYVKCLSDKSRIYFIENYLSTFNADERKEVPFKLFPRQKVYLKTLVGNDNIVTVKHRQCGITTVTSAWVTGQLVFAAKESPETVLCIGNKKDISEQLVSKIGAFLDQVPRWMWGDEFYSPDPDSPKNTKSIYKKRNSGCIELFNGCIVHARSSGENASRGISAVSVLIFDEAAFIQNGVSVYSSAVAACASVSHAKIVLISTPNGKDPLYWRTYDNAINKRNNFEYVEFKWFQDLRYNKNLKWIKKNEETGETETIVETVIGKKGEIKYDEERWNKLEKEGWKPTSPWYVNMCKSFNNDEQKIAQELDISFLGSSDTVVPIEVIEKHSQENVIQITDDWNLRDNLVKETWIWKDPIPGHRYIISCDPSSGSGGDYSAIQVIDVDAVDENGIPFFDQVLEYNGKLNGSEVGQLVYRYGTVYNNALAVVEAIGGYGDSIILTLQELGYPNLYYDDTNLKNYTSDTIKAKKNSIDNKQQLPGFRTNALRLQMISNFIELLKNNSFRVRSTRVISELGTWIFKNGRPDHMDGMNDDLLTCLAMGLFVMQFYMIKNDRIRTKDKIMVGSWAINNYSNTNYNTKQETKLTQNVSEGSNMILNPFVDRYKQIEKKHMDGCMMLGGYYTTFKHKPF